MHGCNCDACSCTGCPVSCFGATCDQWVELFPDTYTCELLEDAFDCDCTSCMCTVAPPPSPSPPSVPRPQEVAACEDKKGSKWCSKKLSKCSKDKISAKCELSCGVCGGATAPPPPSPACEYVDKKGTEWCAKKAKNAKKLSKLCASGKAKKCEATCGC